MDLSTLLSLSNHRERHDAYKAHLEHAILNHDQNTLETLVDHLAHENTPLLLSRALLSDIARQMPNLPTELMIALGEHTLAQTLERAASFDEQVSAIRELLAEAYKKDEQWTAAARMLAAIALDSRDDEYKISKSIQIAMLFLQDDDAVSAETFINRASLMLDPERTSPMLTLQHKVCYARILDSKRKFLEAATRFYQLSHTVTRVGDGFEVSEEDLMGSLRMAATNAILAPAGPARSRLLGTLMKDERSQRLPHRAMLEKVYTGRLLRRDEVEAFAATLASHQKVTHEDGFTVLDRAVTEHNMLALASLYKNISFEQLGALLGIHEKLAEAVAVRMLVEKRLKGTIDQVESVLHFWRESESSALSADDAHIAHICASVESCATAVIALHPELAQRS